ncbi:MAG: homocysteine S-methyltransferase family protein [Candidatus Aminicenantes bacterium]|nr:homocysteine S-methyltransferase family protein [Candidatus Aminicenantes bacterium]
MKTFLERIKNGDVLVGDGAMGSFLMDMAGDLIKGTSPEVVNLSKPEVLEQVAKMYFDAGADLIQTNTFGGSPLKLADYKMEDKTEEINRAAVQAVRKVTGNKAYISASVGPSGKMLKPLGPVSEVQMFDNFYRQIKVLVEEGVDILCIETMTDIKEAVLALKAARDISKTIPVMSTMTYNPSPRGFFTIMGVNVEKAARELAEFGANLVGSNCGNGIENMVLIAREYKKYSKLPLIIQANAGLPELQDDKPVYPENPEFMAGQAFELIDAGVQVVGGCCGTTPEHIRAFRRTVDNM